MPLPHFKNTKTEMVELQHTNLFEVDIITNVDGVDLSIIKETITSVSERLLIFNACVIDQKFQPMTELTKLIGKKFSINIKLTDVAGNITGIYTLNNIEMRDFNTLGEFCSIDLSQIKHNGPRTILFKYNSEDVITELAVKISPENISFNDVVIKIM